MNWSVNEMETMRIVCWPLGQWRGCQYNGRRRESAGSSSPVLAAITPIRSRTWCDGWRTNMADGRRTETSRGLVHLQFWFLLLGKHNRDEENKKNFEWGNIARHSGFQKGIGGGVAHLVSALLSEQEVPGSILGDFNVCFDFALIRVARA